MSKKIELGTHEKLSYPPSYPSKPQLLS